MTKLASACRILAILIALAGVIDPTMTSLRATRADIAIVSVSTADSALVRRIAERLDNRYTVVRGDFPAAAATIIVGSSIPDRIPTGLVFAVRDSNRPTITKFDVPVTTTVDSKLVIPIVANGPVTLRASGLVADHVIPSNARDLHLEVTLTITGPLFLEATVRKGNDSTTVSALTNVSDRRHAVLFFDRRPSWMSTFVRRSLEQDRRFAVASRVMTSRNVSTDAGQPPSTLADPALLELYDVIVIGAPNLLTPGDVSGLETFLAKRGGGVVLLYDEKPTAGPADRLTRVTRWTPGTSRAAINADSTLHLTEAAWPTALPPGGTSRIDATFGAASHPVVWTVGAGIGQVIVSGALDSWKYRDPATSAFDEFWRATISRAAREAQQAILVEATPNVAEPNERISIRITLRDTTAKPTLTLDSTRIDVWPTNEPGQFTARLRATAIGDHILRASAAGNTTEAPIAIRETVTRAVRDDWTTLSMLATASGGIAGSLSDVESAIRGRALTEPRMERWWPMRSAWWILPFTMLLGVEWLVRRRRGLA